MPSRSDKLKELCGEIFMPLLYFSAFCVAIFAIIVVFMGAVGVGMKIFQMLGVE